MKFSETIENRCSNKWINSGDYPKETYRIRIQIRTFDRILMKFSENVENAKRSYWLDFGIDSDPDPNPNARCLAEVCALRVPLYSSYYCN